MLSDFDSHGHRSDFVKDFSSEAHNLMALRIYDLTKERHMRELILYIECPFHSCHTKSY
jgi:hypothetical protein